MGVYLPGDVFLKGEIFFMDVRDEIVARVDKLPPEMRTEVLRFVASLEAKMPKGEPGIDLRAFSGSLDPVSAREMTRVIEEEFERVDARDWQ